MKKLFFFAIAFLVVAFLVSVALSVFFSAGLDRIWTGDGAEEDQGRAVAVLLPSERDEFWDDLMEALKAEGRRTHVSYEVTRYTPTDETAREVIEKSALSRFDALLCVPPDSVDISDVVNLAESRGLPVVLLEKDLPNSKRRVFLGAGSFQMGFEVGRLVRQLPGPVHSGGVLLSQSNRDRQTVRNSLFMNGLNEGLGARAAEITLQELISPPGRFAGEELVWGLLRQEGAVQVLVTTNTKDTRSALETIVEANRVGKTQLVGVAEDSTSRAALAQGLIAGLIARDPKEWAQRISGTLLAMFSGQSLSSYVNLPIHALTSKEVRVGN